MSKGNALMWNQQYCRSHFQHGVITDTWNLFKDRLKTFFQDVGQEQNALRALTNLKQGNMSIEELNTRFLLHGHKAGLSFDDTIAVTVGNQTVQTPNANQQTLISMYTMALNSEIAEKIILLGSPTTINEWMAKSAEVDSAYQRTRSLYGKGIQGYGKKNWKPRLSQTEYRGEPMDIGYVGQGNQTPKKTQGPRMTPEEENRRRENRLCFRCGKGGHGSKQCRAPRNIHPPGQGSSTPQGRSSFPKKQDQKKKYNPTQMRQHIRSLISDNFEEDSPEYQQFVQEVEDKGF